MPRPPIRTSCVRVCAGTPRSRRRSPSRSARADGALPRPVARACRALSELHRIGVVVHPTRDLDVALDAIRAWSDERDVEVVQVKVEGQERRVAEERDASDCDLIAAIGGDGTMLAAMGAALEAERPVLGIACGSLGVLTTVTAEDTTDALDKFADDDWFESRIPAIEVRPDGDEPLLALNDIAV